MQNLNRALSTGQIPNELNYTSSKLNDPTIDLLKLRYNTFYKTPQFFDKRFHPCLKSLPGYETILDNLVEQNKENSLTKEMQERKECTTIKEVAENIISDEVL